MKNLCIFIVIVFVTVASTLNAQIDSLRVKITQLIEHKNAEVGVSIIGIETGDTLSIYGNKRFPMQSVYKLHIAMAVLQEVDNGQLSLNQEVYVKENDLLTDTWSPLRNEFPEGNVNIPLCKIISYTVSSSDNIGCDILLALIGGPQIVEGYIKSLGIQEISITSSEAEMHKNRLLQFDNWTSPNAANQLLKLFFDYKTLSISSSDFLWKCMTESTTGFNRIRSQLPYNTIVAHKTGSSGTTDIGVTAATNDIGIVSLPNGSHFAISIFITNSTESESTNEKIIADISKAAWDYFTEKQAK